IAVRITGVDDLDVQHCRGVLLPQVIALKECPQTRRRVWQLDRVLVMSHEIALDEQLFGTRYRRECRQSDGPRFLGPRSSVHLGSTMDCGPGTGKPVRLTHKRYL